MYYLKYHADYETSQRAGAEGMFQVVSIEDDKGKDLTYLVDQGINFHGCDELRRHIAERLHVDEKEVELEEV